MSGVIVASNGLAFAPEKADAPGEISGLYRRVGQNVLLMERDGTPFALACFNDDQGRPGRGDGFMVSAGLCDGRLRYSFALTTRDEARLGLADARFSEQRQFAKSLRAGLQ